MQPPAASLVGPTAEGQQRLTMLSIFGGRKRCQEPFPARVPLAAIGVSQSSQCRAAVRRSISNEPQALVEPAVALQGDAGKWFASPATAAVCPSDGPRLATVKAMDDLSPLGTGQTGVTPVAASGTNGRGAAAADDAEHL